MHAFPLEHGEEWISQSQVQGGMSWFVLGNTVLDIGRDEVRVVGKFASKQILNLAVVIAS